MSARWNPYRRVIPSVATWHKNLFRSVLTQETRLLHNTQPRFVGATRLTPRFSNQVETGTTCMLHHAARASKRTLLTRASSPEPANTWPGSTFTTALRVAAARAWTRTAVGSPRNVSSSASVTSEEENTTRTRKRLPGGLSDNDPGSWSDWRQVPPFA